MNKLENLLKRNGGIYVTRKYDASLRYYYKTMVYNNIPVMLLKGKYNNHKSCVYIYFYMNKISDLKHLYDFKEFNVVCPFV